MFRHILHILSDTIAYIPDSLYMLLSLVVSGQTSLEDDGIGGKEKLPQRRVLNEAKVLVYCFSDGKKWTPKHVSLACTLHQAIG